MVVINVDGKDYELTEKHESVMIFIQQAKIIEQGGIKITNITQDTFEKILNILVTLNYDIKEPPKVKTGVVEDIIGKELATLIGHLSPKELNLLYGAAHYLKIEALRKSIAAVVACKVYINPTLEEYNNKKVELGLEKELNTETSKGYKEKYPFMN